MIRWTVHFTGHVQGVGFRHRTREIARNMEVAGYVCNLDDGRVQVVAEGQVEALGALVDQVRGWFPDQIRAHTMHESPATGEFGVPRAGGLVIRH